MFKLFRNIRPEEGMTKLFREFFESERNAGIVLILCTIVSMVLSNYGPEENYTNFWNLIFAGHSLREWINDGLMAVFFLLIGLELEREIYEGELSSFKKTLFPVFAAIGGMVIPGLIYFGFNAGTVYGSGFGIPMATDIAFALAVLSMIKNVPLSMKILLTGIAIVDDLGAILIIAFFYSKAIIIQNLAISLGIFGVLIVLNRLKVNNLIPYIIGGIIMWYFMSLSGVHATISGVLLAFAIPFRRKNHISPSDRLQHSLHLPVAFIILPLFALANTAFIINTELITLLSKTYARGIMAGLVIGKPLGVIIMVYIAMKLKIVIIPELVSWRQIAGIGSLAGIGFTMSIFITLLAFNDSTVINNSKLSILLASLVSGIIGYFLISSAVKKNQPKTP